MAIARGISTIIPQADEKIRSFDQVFIMARTEDMMPLMDMMKIDHKNIEHMMILGGGLVGRRVAQLLEKEVEIKLIEKNPERAEELGSELKNTEVIHGDGTDANLLVMSGLDSTESFIATTGDNETNIISCLLAKHLMNRKNREQQGSEGKTVALVNKEDYLVLASTIGLDIALNAKISVAQLLSLKGTAKLTGDLVTNKLAIEPGAAFTGHCSMGAVIKDIKHVEKTASKEKTA